MLSKSNLFRIKFTISILAVSAVSLVGYSFYRAEERKIFDEVKRDTAVLSDLIKIVLKNNMTDGKGERTQELVEEMTLLTAVHGVHIYSREGILRFSSTPADVGTKGNLEDPSCAVCHGASTRPAIGKAGIVMGVEGRILRTVDVIGNEEECLPCHSGEEESLGVLMVDLSLTEKMTVMDHFRKATFFLVLSITMVFATLVFLNQVFDYFHLKR